MAHKSRLSLHLAALYLWMEICINSGGCPLLHRFLHLPMDKLSLEKTGPTQFLCRNWAGSSASYDLSDFGVIMVKLTKAELQKISRATLKELANLQRIKTVLEVENVELKMRVHLLEVAIKSEKENYEHLWRMRIQDEQERSKK